MSEYEHECPTCGEIIVGQAPEIVPTELLLLILQNQRAMLWRLRVNDMEIGPQIAATDAAIDELKGEK